ncbi:MAG: beta-glucosidase [Psychromonas sp.]|jgi:beta-glucosidase|uniref:glycoside hydrolase family 3 protein n=1 Tax=Psychromonas sp. TaxID=1884585 RepID=UPI0039E602A8
METKKMHRRLMTPLFMLLPLAATTLVGCNYDSSYTEPVAQSNSPITYKTDRTEWPAITSKIALDEQIETKVQVLVDSMTLAEKIGQMTQPEIKQATPEDVITYHLGSVLNGGGSWPNNDKQASLSDWVTLADDYWVASMNGDDGYEAIPLIWGTDAVHGHSNVYGATIFPHNIGLGAGNDTDLIRRIGAATAAEVAATGVDWTFAPTLAVVRDDRWGRTYEGYSENPEIVFNFGGAMVEGLQGEFTQANVVATAKHYIGDGGTELGADQGNNSSTEEQMINIHAQGYYSALQAGAQTVMASFNSWQGSKLHGHEYLLTTVLKEKMGFDGFVISDWDGIGQVDGCDNSSCAQAINAGVDMIMVPNDWKAFITNTIAQVKAGEISAQRIDDAVTRILRVKMRAGMFSHPRPSERQLAGDSTVLASTAHRAIAREAVRKSLVLLKNKKVAEKSVLPLNPASKILVTGVSADSMELQTGGWTLSWQGTGNTNDEFPNGNTILDGIRAAVSAAGGTVDYSADGSLADDVSYDVIIVALGETPYAEGQGDISKFRTLGFDTLPKSIGYEVLNTVSANVSMTPIVTLYVGGRPLWMNKQLNKSDVFIAAWLPGSEGSGVADVLFGDYPFVGKLSYSWPATDCQTSLNIGDENYAPLFAYGFGLLTTDQDLLSDSLDEAESSTGCDVPQAGTGTTNTPLPVFENGDNASGFIAKVGSGSNWDQDISIDPNETTISDGAVLNVNIVNGESQYSALDVTWELGGGQLYFQTSDGLGADRSDYLNSNTSLMFNVKVNTPATADQVVSLQTHCVYPCVSPLDITSLLSSFTDSDWHEVSIPLQCFTDLDITNVNVPFLIYAEDPLAISLENIRWMPDTADAEPNCDAFGAQADVIDASEVVIFDDAMSAGYSLTNYQNDTGAIIDDGTGNMIFSATLNPESNVAFHKDGLPADLSAYDVTTAKLQFDVYFSAIEAGSDVIVKMATDWPNLSDISLFADLIGGTPTLDTWVAVEVPIQTLIASENRFSPGSSMDISSIVDILVLETTGSVEGSTSIYVDNIRLTK